MTPEEIIAAFRPLTGGRIAAERKVIDEPGAPPLVRYSVYITDRSLACPAAVHTAASDAYEGDLELLISKVRTQLLRRRCHCASCSFPSRVGQ